MNAVDRESEIGETSVTAPLHASQDNPKFSRRNVILCWRGSCTSIMSQLTLTIFPWCALNVVQVLKKIAELNESTQQRLLQETFRYQRCSGAIKLCKLTQLTGFCSLSSNTTTPGLGHPEAKYRDARDSPEAHDFHRPILPRFRLQLEATHPSYLEAHVPSGR